MRGRRSGGRRAALSCSEVRAEDELPELEVAAFPEGGLSGIHDIVRKKLKRTREAEAEGEGGARAAPTNAVE